MTAPVLERFKYNKVSFDLDERPLSEWIRLLRDNDDNDKTFEFFVEDGKAFFLAEELPNDLDLTEYPGIEIRTIYIWSVQ